MTLGFRLVTRKVRVGKKRTQCCGSHSESSHAVILRLTQQLELPKDCSQRLWVTLVGTPVGIWLLLIVYLARTADSGRDATHEEWQHLGRKPCNRVGSGDLMLEITGVRVTFGERRSPLTKVSAQIPCRGLKTMAPLLLCYPKMKKLNRYNSCVATKLNLQFPTKGADLFLEFGQHQQIWSLW